MSRRQVLGLLLALSALAFGAVAATIRGTVQTFDGMPIGRAGVLLLGSLRAFTDYRGAYELKAIPQGVYDLKIEIAGFPSVQVKSLSVRSDESKTLPPITVDVSAACEGPYAPQWLELTESQRSFGVLTSTVSESRGKPLPGVQVEVLDGTQVRPTTTDVQGTFRVSNLPPGLYSIRLHRGRYWDAFDKNVRVQAGYVAAYGPFTLARCPLGWCNPIFKRRRIAHCE